MDFIIKILEAFKEPEVIAGILGGTALTVISGYIIYLLNTKEYIFFYLYSHFLSLQKKQIRFSISYLYRIQVHGKYLLIKGNRIEQFQPVGGVFKYYSNAEELFSNYGVLTDNNIPVDTNSNKDLRIRLKAKNAYKFFQWFNSRRNREISIIREFQEELINTGYIPKGILNNFRPEYIKTHFNGIKYSTHFKCHEVLIAEIYHLRLTSDQEEEIAQYLNIKKNTKITLVTAEEIEKKNVVINGKSYNISPTALWTI